MNVISFLTTVFFVPLFCLGQNNNDTITHTKNWEKTKWMRIEPSTHYFKNGKIQMQGQHLCERHDHGGFCFPIGFWDYYYESGQLKLQDFTYCDSLDFMYTNRKLINMWMPDGTQVLKNGQGFYYEVNASNTKTDSLFFEVKDSLKNGIYKSYSKYDDKNYVLVQYGQYYNSKRTGTFIRRDSLYREFEEKVYDGDKEISHYRYFNEDYKLLEEGMRINGYKNGNWKFYGYSDGVLYKEVNYTNNSKFGEYKEYYPNGQIAVEGCYDHSEKFDPVSYGNNNRYDDNSRPVGEWKYYTKKGKLKKTVKY